MDHDLGRGSRKRVGEEVPAENTKRNNGVGDQEEVAVVLSHHLVPRLPDYISRMHKDCLLLIAEHLNREDIYNMSLANKKLHVLADKIKWEGGDLFMYQTAKGYGFHYTVECDEYPLECPISYMYEAWDEDGVVAEMRTIDSNPVEEEEFDDHGWPIPDEYFVWLSKLLRNHRITNLKIEDIPFDCPNLFYRIITTMAGQNIVSLKCEKMKCNALTNDIRMSFAQLIKGVRKVDMRNSEDVPSLMGASFLSDIAESKLREYRDPHWEPHVRLGIPTLHRLVKLDTLEARCIFVDVNMVARLCMMYMDARPLYSTDNGHWTFSVNQPITNLILGQNIRPEDYEYDSHIMHDLDEDYEHFITRKADGFKACFFRWIDDNDARNGPNQHFVVVEFMDQRRMNEMAAEARREYDGEEFSDDDE